MDPNTNPNTFHLTTYHRGVTKNPGRVSTRLKPKTQAARELAAYIRNPRRKIRVTQQSLIILDQMAAGRWPEGSDGQKLACRYIFKFPRFHAMDYIVWLYRATLLRDIPLYTGILFPHPSWDKYHDGLRYERPHPDFPEF